MPDLDPQAQQMYDRVPADGSGIGNTSLQRLLGWPDDDYWRVRDDLIEIGLLAVGRGRGGSVRRIDIAVPEAEVDFAPVPDGVMIGEPADPLIIRESDLYAPMREVIQGDFARDRRLTHLAVEVTAQQGGRITGGRWSRPDVVTVSVTTYLHVPGRVLDLTTFEIKPTDAVDVVAVYEALSHRRSATRSYVIFHIPDERLAVPSLADALEAVCEEARTHGIGIIVAGRPDDYGTWDERVPAERHEPDPARLDAFISTQLSDAIARRIATQVR